MGELLWLLPALPMAGFFVLALFGARLPRAGVAGLGTVTVGASTIIAAMIGTELISSTPTVMTLEQNLGTWMSAASFTVSASLRLDALSLLMVLIVTLVGLLIHIYSTAFMADDDGYGRFFAYMNLFVAAMLVLVLADDLVLLYLGWEGVGLCSYLLIGFWYNDPANSRAAQKAFLVTRVGDVAMAIALMLIFTELGTLRIEPVLQRAVDQWPEHSATAMWVAALFLVAAAGKSAQFPLHVWLPDAMAGPSPVSALIHAATMVTAGVYLIARLHILYTLTPAVQAAVAVVAVVTILLAACSALAQRDLKRVLAYSTISQIGYMFLALGVGAWSAAMFHFMTHAFFKALLFLGAGVVISSLDGEHDMFAMGGLRRRLPYTFWMFLIGASSLAAVPLVTAGFYSKDTILLAAWASPSGNLWFWAAGVVGAVLTSLYTFRMVFLVFFGQAHQEPRSRPSALMLGPMAVLTLLSVFGGLVELPGNLGGFHGLSGFLDSALPPQLAVNPQTETILQIVVGAAVLGGIAVQYVLYVVRPQLVRRLAKNRSIAWTIRWWFADWGMDRLYERLFVQPYVWLATANRHDVLDRPFEGLARLNEWAWLLLGRTQTGSLRWYVAAIIVGTIVIIAGVVSL